MKNQTSQASKKTSNPTKKENIIKIIILLIIGTTVCFLPDSIKTFFPKSWINWNIVQFLSYFVIPAFSALILFKESPISFGLRLGEWKFGLLAIILCCAVMAGPLYYCSNLESFRSYYGEKKIDPFFIMSTIILLFSWEYLFRGYWLFGLEKRFGADAIWIQSVPFALAHLGKPNLEALTSLFGGFVLGYIAWRTKSFIPAFIIHSIIFIMLMIFLGG